MKSVEIPLSALVIETAGVYVLDGGVTRRIVHVQNNGYGTRRTRKETEEALKASQLIETALSTSKESEADKRYLEALAETYNNASTWGTRRQILSVMADLVTFERMQAYIPDLTEFRFKEARKHKVQHGRGVPQYS